MELVIHYKRIHSRAGLLPHGLAALFKGTATPFPTSLFLTPSLLLVLMENRF